MEIYNLVDLIISTQQYLYISTSGAESSNNFEQFSWSTLPVGDSTQMIQSIVFLSNIDSIIAFDVRRMQP